MNRHYPLMLIFLIALLAVSITATVLAVNASMPFLTAASLLFAISACIGLYRLHLRQTETIRRAADSIAQGDLTINLRPPFADSEIAHQCTRLADAIHDMRLRLSETEARSIYCSQLLEEVDTVYDGITYNYKDGTDTITFGDVQTALADRGTDSAFDASTAPKRKTRLRRVFLFGNR